MNYILGQMKFAALGYARRGWAVFPVHTIKGRGCSCWAGQACSAIAKHPSLKKDWQGRATTDEKVIAHWWRQTAYNIGVVTGSKSKIIVLDVDNKGGKQGSKTLDRLFVKHDWRPRTLTAKTGNGFHLYFQYAGMEIPTSIEGLGDGLDIKGEGGYVVAPPSFHRSFNHYKWRNPEAVVEQLPGWFTDAVSEKRRATADSAVRSLANGANQAVSDEITEGTRNDTLFRRGCAMRGQGHDQGAIEARLLWLNAHRCNPPLDEWEVRLIAWRAASYLTEQVKTQRQPIEEWDFEEV